MLRLSILPNKPLKKDRSSKFKGDTARAVSLARQEITVLPLVKTGLEPMEQDRNTAVCHAMKDPLPDLAVSRDATVKGETGELWKRLCAQAAEEQDSDRLLKLVKETNRLLDEKEARLVKERRERQKQPKPD